ncbi:MAG: hypothetical protein ACODAE_06420 [Gemmatimonadota bacterium]
MERESRLRPLIGTIREKGMAWARLRRELSALQNRRKAVQVELRDRLMAEAEARGEPLSKTAATEAARAHPEYIACLDEIALKQFETDAAEVEYTTARAIFRAAALEPDEAGRLAAA